MRGREEREGGEGERRGREEREGGEGGRRGREERKQYKHIVVLMLVVLIPAHLQPIRKSSVFSTTAVSSRVPSFPSNTAGILGLGREEVISCSLVPSSTLLLEITTPSPLSFPSPSPLSPM